MKAWIDFKELRSKLNFETILQHYGVEVKRKGEQHHGYPHSGDRCGDTLNLGVFFKNGSSFCQKAPPNPAVLTVPRSTFCLGAPKCCRGENELLCQFYSKE